MVPGQVDIVPEVPNSLTVAVNVACTSITGLVRVGKKLDWLALD